MPLGGFEVLRTRLDFFDELRARFPTDRVIQASTLVQNDQVIRFEPSWATWRETVQLSPTFQIARGDGVVFVDDGKVLVSKRRSIWCS